MPALIEQIIGYRTKKTANVTILDLHGVPFEVHSLVVSLLSRIVFDVGFYRKRILAEAVAPADRDEVAFLVVYEEAHKYVPRTELARYRSVTKSIERIAKEGRKYGICLMIVSQRPSDVSETVFSQCNSFVAMRLTNPADQAYVKALLPDALAGLTDALPTLQQREALVVGECVPVPTLLRIAEIEQKPDSRDIRVLQEWRKDWVDLEFGPIIDAMKQY
jgi:DNA helicase HerA-like ATPase